MLGKKSTNEDDSESLRAEGDMTLIEHLTELRQRIIKSVIAIVAGVFGFAGIADGAASIAKILFFVFVVLAVLSLIFNGLRGKKP